MKFSRILLIGLSVLLLSACKVELITQVKESYFEEGKGDNLGTALRAEVAGCQDYEDSKKESDSLIKAKDMIPKMFKDAEYVECNRKGMDSWAVFKIEIAIFRGKPEGNRVGVYRTKEDFIGFYFPEILDLKMNEVSSKEFVKFKPTLFVSYVNDTDKSVDIILDNLYLVKGEKERVAYLDRAVTVKPGEDIYVQASDILIDYLRANQSRGVFKR